MAKYGGAMKAGLKGPGGMVGGGGGGRGTINYNAANTPRPGSSETKAAGGTPSAKPFTGIWAPLIGRPGKG